MLYFYKSLCEGGHQSIKFAIVFRTKSFFSEIVLKKRFYLLTISLLLLLLFWFCLPRKLFHKPLSLVVTGRNNELLGAKLAKDGQWRFPTTDSLPEKYKHCVLQFEDKRFLSHWGVDLLAFGRAMWGNIKAGRIVSGGSTVTMQVIRLSRNNPPRTYWEKLLEVILAMRLELRCTKNEILNHYASNAPFGGNVVGIETAAYRYFGIGLHQLTWAECATLAVLPNSPGLIHPGRNRNALREKRNRLLKRLWEKKIIDEESYLLSIDEDLPEKPRPFPKIAPHLVSRIETEKNLDRAKKQKTTLSVGLQKKITRIVAQHHNKLKRNQVHNLAVLVLDVKTGEVRSYVGNHFNLVDEINGYQVDIINSPRSTGSILKPFLYASMLSEGEILPNSLVPDIPTFIGSFAPKNYNLTYDGAVPANHALARSLNIPAVRMLMNYSVPKFHNDLKTFGLTSLNHPSGHYGLSLILGGAEGTLWDICGVYASMARSLLYYEANSGRYDANAFRPPTYFSKQKKKTVEKEHGIISASACWFTFEAMLDVERPGVDNNWRSFSSAQKIAWKTGTSFGYRDAWAVGVTPGHVVGVWVGNADGEGRPGIVGVRAAAPILFEVFDLLPSSSWFPKPFDDMIEGRVCSKSGYLAGQHCDETEKRYIPSIGERSNTCPYHRTIHLDKTEQFQVSEMCERPENMIHKKWFVLPPMMEWFYKSKNAHYKTLPPFREGCQKDQQRSMQIIYPQQHTEIFIPRGLDSKRQKTVFEVAHRNPSTEIYWYIDDKYVGMTKQFHQIAVSPKPGKHILSITDAKGNQVQVSFEALEATSQVN